MKLLELGFWFRNSLEGARVIVKSTRWVYDGLLADTIKYQFII